MRMLFVIEMLSAFCAAIGSLTKSPLLVTPEQLMSVAWYASPAIEPGQAGESPLPP